MAALNHEFFLRNAPLDIPGDHLPLADHVVAVFGNVAGLGGDEELVAPDAVLALHGCE